MGMRANPYPQARSGAGQSTSGRGSATGGLNSRWTGMVVTPPKSVAGQHTTPRAEQATDSLDNIAKFFGGRTRMPGSKLPRPTMEVAPARSAGGFQKGNRVRHGKYGEGTVLLREGDGEDAKLTVHFPRAGVKKLVERFAQLERL